MTIKPSDIKRCAPDRTQARASQNLLKPRDA